MYRNLPVSLTLTVLGFIIILHALKTRHKKRNSVLLDELLLGALHIVSSFFYPLFYNRYAEVSDILFLITNTFIGITLFSITAIILREVIKVKWNPKLRIKRSYEAFRNRFLAGYSKKNQYKRRLTHVIPAAVILPIYLISKSLAPVMPHWEAWSVCLITTIGISFVLFFSIGDLFRVNKPHLLPDWGAKLFTSGLNKKEVKNNTFSTTSAMVLAFAPWILTGFLIFTVVVLVASVSDALAAITGFRFGKRNFPKKSKKTVEGYIAGILSTFGLVILMFFILSRINPLYILIIGSLSALIFFLVDLIDLPIDDNKINPQAIGVVLLVLLASI